MKKKEKTNLYYILVFIISIILTLITHYLFISKIELHPTIHVAFSLIIFWFFLSVIAVIKDTFIKK